jgi:hypothetical protein
MGNNRNIYGSTKNQLCVQLLKNNYLIIYFPRFPDFLEIHDNKRRFSIYFASLFNCNSIHVMAMSLYARFFFFFYFFFDSFSRSNLFTLEPVRGHSSSWPPLHCIFINLSLKSFANIVMDEITINNQAEILFLYNANIYIYIFNVRCLHGKEKKCYLSYLYRTNRQLIQSWNLIHRLGVHIPCLHTYTTYSYGNNIIQMGCYKTYVDLGVDIVVRIPIVLE